MNKTEFTAAVAEAAGVSKADSKKVIDAAIETVVKQLAAGETISFVGFGTFQVKDVAEAERRNPATGEAITIPAHKAPTFKVSQAVKKAING